MSDNISREAALKVVCDSCVYGWCPDDDKCEEYEAMKNLPSADSNADQRTQRVERVDTISRADAIDIVRFECGEWRGLAKTIENGLNDLPSAEQKTGHWIPVDSYSAYGGDEATWGAHGNPIAFYYCSECKGHAYAGETGESLLTDFCPNCGAYMRG